MPGAIWYSRSVRKYRVLQRETQRAWRNFMQQLCHDCHVSRFLVGLFCSTALQIHSVLDIIVVPNMWFGRSVYCIYILIRVCVCVCVLYVLSARCMWTFICPNTSTHWMIQSFVNTKCMNSLAYIRDVPYMSYYWQLYFINVIKFKPFKKVVFDKNPRKTEYC